MSKKKKCSECNAYYGHAPNCSKMSREYAKSELKRYHKSWLEADTELRKVKEQLETAKEGLENYKNSLKQKIKTCNNHGFIVIHTDDDCPVCDIIHDNFRMRTQLLTGAKLANYDVCRLPKYIQSIFRDISVKKCQKKH